MRKLSTCIVMMMFLVVLSAAVSAAGMLEISELEAEVDNDKQSADENGGTIDILPDSLLELSIEVENLYDPDIEGGEIEDIEIEVVIEDVDDGDDLDDISEDFDLKPGRDKTVRMDFQMPLRLKTDENFKMFINIDGEDKNGTRHTIELEFDVEVDKETHELRFLRKELTPSTINCEGTSTLILSIINTGEEDEEVELIIDAPNFEYNVRKEFELYEDIDDDENEFEFTDRIEVEDVPAGEHPVNIRAIYRDGRETLEDTLYLTVEECEAPEPEPEPEEQEQEPEQEEQEQEPEQEEQEQEPEPEPEEVVVTEPQQSSYVRPASTAVATPRTSYTQQSWWDKNKWIAIVMITNLVLIVAGIIVIAAVLRRRR